MSKKYQIAAKKQADDTFLTHFFALSTSASLPTDSMRNQYHNQQQLNYQYVTGIHLFYYHPLACKTLRFRWQEAVSYNSKRNLLANYTQHPSQRKHYKQHQKATNEDIHICLLAQTYHNIKTNTTKIGISQYTRAHSS